MLTTSKVIFSKNLALLIVYHYFLTVALYWPHLSTIVLNDCQYMVGWPQESLNTPTPISRYASVCQNNLQLVVYNCTGIQLDHRNT